VRRREPVPDLGPKLIELTAALEELRKGEADLEQRRERFRAALRAAHEAGASYGLLGRHVGLSRQRVAELVKPE
jgi:hypothetical protein